MLLVTDEQIKEFETFLKNHNFFFIIGHKEPDGDAIYSCLAMADLLKKKNLNYQLLSAGPFKRPEIKEHSASFSNTMKTLSDDEKKQAGIIVLDCSEESRFGDVFGNFDGISKFIIDHHKTADVQDNSIIDPSAPATASIVQQIYEKTVGTPTKEVAEYLFNGLSTDTGYFRFLNENSAEVFRSAARLVEAGANPRKTYDFITGGKIYNTRKLLGLIIDHAERKFNNKLVVTYETQEDTALYGKEGRDSDALYSLFLAAEEVEAVLFVRQESENNCTCGFRSRDKVDVSAIAAKFGGGGHKNAAGLGIEGKIPEVIEKICAEFEKVL